MTNANLGETLGTLETMNSDLSNRALVELRGGYQPNLRQRLEKIMTFSNALTETRGGHQVFGTGGNSAIFTLPKNRLLSERAYGVSARYLRLKDGGPELAIYPFGIKGLTADSRPIFEVPSESKMRSIAVVRSDYTDKFEWLQYKIEPLFNIDEEGMAYARISDQPTPAELQLLHDILEEFEYIR